MISQAIKTFVVYKLWRWFTLHGASISTLLLSLLIVNYFHAEYIRYLEILNDTSRLAISFIIKYGLTFLAITFFYVRLKLAYENNGLGPSSGHSLTKKEPASDGFDSLRQKKNLDGRAEKILNNKKLLSMPLVHKVGKTPNQDFIHAKPCSQAWRGN